MTGDAVDLPAYFARIGHRGDGAADLNTLREITVAHTRAIPFENLDPLTGVPVADLGASALFDKLVHHRRGGYCFEHNGLLAYVLEALGYGVQRFAGRVLWRREDDAVPAQTHQLLAVRVPDVEGRFLVDVGFGGQTPPEPLRFEIDVEQPTSHEPYRIRARGDEFVMETLVHGAWQPLYVFADRVVPRIDLEVGSWYVSTYPQSVFVVGLTAALVTDDARWNLRGRHLAVHRGGATERIEFDSAAAVLDVLVERFGIDLSAAGERGALEKRVYEVLDA